VALTLLPAGPAIAQATDRQTGSLRFTTSEPGAPTGNELAADWRNPTDPDGKPFSVARLVIRLHPGTVIDTSVQEQCKASDAQLQAQGAQACPAASRVGGGTIVSDTGSSGGFPRFNENRIDNFNNEGELIGVADATNLPPAPGIGRVVSRSKISGTSTTIEFPAFPGNPPPDNFTAIKTLRTSAPAFVRGDRTGLRTPPTCPDSGHWTNTLIFTYRDGVSQTVESHSPCRSQASGSKPCLSRRSPIGRSNIGRVALGAPGVRLLALPVKTTQPRTRVTRFCVKAGRGSVTAVAGRSGRAELVVSTAPGHGNRGVRPGARSVSFPRGRRLGPGLVRRGRSRQVVGVRNGRVRFVAVAGRRLLRDPRALRGALRRAGL